MESINNLLQPRRQHLDRQQAQIDQLSQYLKTHYPKNITIATRPDELRLSTSDPALASQLQLDWANLVKYCHQPQQKLTIKIIAPKS